MSHDIFGTTTDMMLKLYNRRTVHVWQHKYHLFHLSCAEDSGTIGTLQYACTI